MFLIHVSFTIFAYYFFAKVRGPKISFKSNTPRIIYDVLNGFFIPMILVMALMIFAYSAEQVIPQSSNNTNVITKETTDKAQVVYILWYITFLLQKLIMPGLMKKEWVGQNEKKGGCKRMIKNGMIFTLMGSLMLLFITLSGLAFSISSSSVSLVFVGLLLLFVGFYHLILLICWLNGFFACCCHIFEDE